MICQGPSNFEVGNTRQRAWSFPTRNQKLNSMSVTRRAVHQAAYLSIRTLAKDSSSCRWYRRPRYEPARISRYSHQNGNPGTEPTRSRYPLPTMSCAGIEFHLTCSRSDSQADAMDPANVARWFSDSRPINLLKKSSYVQRTGTSTLASCFFLSDVSRCSEAQSERKSFACLWVHTYHDLEQTLEINARYSSPCLR